MKEITTDGIRCFIENNELLFQQIEGSNQSLPLMVSDGVARIIGLVRDGDTYTVKYEKSDGKLVEEGLYLA